MLRFFFCFVLPVVVIIKLYVCTHLHLGLCVHSRSSTRSATPKRTTRRSGRASVATILCLESCLNFGPPKSNSSRGGWRGGGGLVVLLCFLITRSVMDVWDEKAIQNIKRKEKKTKHRAAGNYYYFFFFCECFFLFFFFFQNEGKMV